ncbi:hypothetical protein [Streptomyces avermitilis]|uniref:hypothetical protein n=1 Tax=Streptomyces avermitilis TaxID=33903 RepID=UPI003825DE7C
MTAKRNRGLTEQAADTAVDQACRPPGRRAGFVCDPCRHWRERTGQGWCCRCDRDGLTLRDDRCRSCHPYRLLDEARPASRRFTQLVISLPTGKGGPFEAYPVGEPEVADYDKRRPASAHEPRAGGAVQPPA